MRVFSTLASSSLIAISMVSLAHAQSVPPGPADQTSKAQSLSASPPAAAPPSPTEGFKNVEFPNVRIEDWQALHDKRQLPHTGNGLGVESIPKATGNIGDSTAKSSASGGSAKTSETVTPLAARSAGTVAAEPPASIAELARALKNDPDLIYEFVRDNIELYPIFGVSKGWRGALIDRQGSNFDQAELMVNLLREAGYTASYVAGVIQLTPAQVQSFYGIDTSKACAAQNLFNQGQIPNNLITNVGDTCDSPLRGILLNHVWARVTIGGSNYDFDPSLKAHTLKAGIDVKAASGYNATNYLASARTGATVTANTATNLNRTNVRANLGTNASNLVNYLRANNPAAGLDDVLGGKTIIPTNLCFTFGPCPTRQTQLPYQNTSYATQLWTGDIPNNYRVLLQVSVTSPGQSMAGINQLLLADYFYGKRLTIASNASLQPVLYADGVPLATGDAVPAGTSASLFVQVVHGAYSSSFADGGFSRLLPSGQMRDIALGVGPVTSALSSIYRSQAAASIDAGQDAASEPVLGASLAGLGADWLSQASMSTYIADRLSNSNTLQHHTVGLVGQAEAPFFDMPSAQVSVVQQLGDANLKAANFATQSLHLSAFETGVLEQVTGQPSLSTIDLIDRAITSGQTIYSATTSNYASEVLPHLTNCGTQSGTFDTFVNAGFRIILPQNCAINLNDWMGAGYLVMSSSGSTIGAFIEGGYAGGYPSIPIGPVDWKILAKVRLQPHKAFDPKQRGDPVDIQAGAFSYGHDDLTVGVGGFPQALGFQRLYNSSSQGSDGPLGRGWTHNLAISAKPFTQALQGLGEDSPLDAAGSIVETMTAIDLLSDPALPVDKLAISMMGSRWFADQLENNAVAVSEGSNSRVFVKLPDGTFNSPPSSSDRLTVAVDGAYRFSTVNKELYSFDADGNVTTWASPNGMEVHFSYTTGQLTNVSNSLGRALSLTYNGTQIASVADGTGRSVSYGYDASGNLTTFADAAGKATTFAYDVPGRMTQYFMPANPAAPQVINVYDSLGRISQQTDADGKIWSYYLAGTRSELVSPMGRRSIDYFDGSGQVLATYESVDGGSSTAKEYAKMVKNEYDGHGRITRIIDSYNPIIEFTYDDATCNNAEKRCTNNILTQRRRAIHTLADTPVLADQIKTYTYEPLFNKIATSVVTSDVPLNYSYDAATGNLIMVTSAPNAASSDGTPTQSSYSYSSFTGASGFPTFTLRTSEIASISATSSVTTNYAYNALNRYVPQTTVLDPGGLNITNTSTYDAVGNLTAIDGPRTDVSDITGYGYDPERRLVSVTDALGKVTSSAYNDDGERIRTSAQIGAQWLATCFTVLPSGKTSKIAGPGLVADVQSCPTAAAPVSVTDLTYDDEGNLLTSTVNRTAAEGGPRVARFTYSPRATLLTEANAVNTSLEQMTIQRTYGTLQQTAPNDSGSTLSQWVPNGGRSRLMRTNGHGLLAEFDPVAGTPDSTTEPGSEKYTYSGSDRLTKITTRDNRAINLTPLAIAGNVATKQVQLPGNQVTYKTTNYTYDALGRRLSAAISGGTSVTYTYDKADRVISTTASGRTVAYQYDPAGNRTRITWPDTTFFVTYSYDALNRLSTVKEAGTTTLATYAYDDMSRVTGMTLGNSTTETLIYNPQGRLSTLTHDLAGTTADVTRTYTYDQAGALKTVMTSNASYDWNGHYNVNRTYGNDGIDAYTTSGSKTFSYDQRGNIAGDGTWTFTYDLENQLLSAAANKGPQLAYGYDALGRLATRTSGSGKSAVTTSNLYDGQQLMGEYSSTGALVRRYVPGAGLDEPLLTYDGTGATTKTWLYGDQQGSITATANASGTLVAAYSYGPFGEPNALTGVALRYTGQRLDPGSGLSYYRARWYSPYLGRFLSPDPIGLAGGTHLYRYAGNDPINYVDPSGLNQQTPNPDNRVTPESLQRNGPKPPSHDDGDPDYNRDLNKCRSLADSGNREAASRCYGSAENRKRSRDNGVSEDDLPPLIEWRQSAPSVSNGPSTALIVGGALVVGGVICIIVEPCGAAVAGGLTVGGAGALLTAP